MNITRLLIYVSALMPVPLAAQCQLCAPSPHPTTKAVAPIKPINISVEAALDFSRMALTGQGQGGSVSVDPLTGQRRVSGGLKDLGGGALKGQVHVEGEPLHPVRVILPNRATLTASDGSSLDVTDLETSLGANPTLGPDGKLDFAFGGKLNVQRAGAGDYHGRIPITVEYQ